MTTPETEKKHPDLALSIRAGHVTNALPKNCWWNARDVVRLGRSRQWLSGAQYVEGWCVDNTIPLIFEHAWVEMPDGTIIEPTLSRKAIDFGGDSFNPADYTYEPALRFGVDDLPDHHRVPWHMRLARLDPSFRDVWMDAYDKAHESVWGMSWRATLSAMAAAQARRDASTATTISVRQHGSSAFAGISPTPAPA